MPYAYNQDVRIYYEVEGHGSPLVLHHASADSGQIWQDLGYCDALKPQYQLIRLDARGHGASDKPHQTAAYDLYLRVADVIAVLDTIGIQQTHYFGYSMGGWIGFGLAKYAPKRIRSLIIGGAHPYAERFDARRAVMRKGREVFLKALEKSFGPTLLTPTLRARLAANDFEALLAMTQDRSCLADMLATLSMPCLLLVGGADPRFKQVQACAQHIPKATFISFPGYDHMSTLGQRDAVLQQVTAFLAQAAW
ncbi:MAG: alpha/beta fold hydrolase [bacterium]|nr:alpha/beta fold hydrolase [bacterium]